jgi:hypothetical protein
MLGAICDGLSPRHYPDAMHFWTAVTNNVDFFLTVDRKFMRILAANRQVKTRTKAISPSDLLKHLGVTTLDAPRLDPGKVYDLFGKPVEPNS